MLELRWTGLAGSAVKEDQKLGQWEYEEGETDRNMDRNFMLGLHYGNKIPCPAKVGIADNFSNLHVLKEL